MPLEVHDVLALAALGLLAGTAGGLAGLGGSIIIIPGLTVLLRRDQHLAQAAAMIVNVFIAVPSLWRHHLAGAVAREVLGRMLPVALVAILAGVFVGNRIDGDVLKRIFAVFLVYVLVMKVFRLYSNPSGATSGKRKRLDWLRLAGVGGGMGFFAGLLGIGGGPIAVPLLQRVCRLPLRQAIAASSAAMCVTSLVGATYKNASLAGLTDAAGAPLGLHATESALVAMCIAPTAALGAIYGAGLTHRLPLFWVRIAFVIMMAGASVAMMV